MWFLLGLRLTNKLITSFCGPASVRLEKGQQKAEGQVQGDPTPGIFIWLIKNLGTFLGMGTHLSNNTRGGGAGVPHLF